MKWRLDYSAKGAMVSLPERSLSLVAWKYTGYIKTKMAVQTPVALLIEGLHRMQVATFVVLPSVSSKEKVFTVLQRKRVSTCANVMDGMGCDVASACKNVKSNIARPRANGTKNTW